MADSEILDVDLVVLGGGPGGYTAAFRAADLGLKTAIVERYSVLGGVCLNVGCVPSKALLHAASLLEGVGQFVAEGVFNEKVTCNVDGLRRWKSSIVSQLNKGLAGLASRRKIAVCQGSGAFIGTNVLMVRSETAQTQIRYQQAIVATGSHSATLSFLPAGKRVWDSTDALTLSFVPPRLLVVGGGVIGLEMATVYQSLGSQVTVVEVADSILPGMDKSTVRPLQLAMKKKMQLFTASGVAGIHQNGEVITVALQGEKCPAELEVDAILVAVGRKPNSLGLGLDLAGVNVDSNGFVVVDEQQRTSNPRIFAIGDVTVGPMLAHRASAEGRIAAEAAVGMNSKRSFLCIPQVAYTSPEIAIAGLSEAQAAAIGMTVSTGKFPFAASARAMTIGDANGFVKLIFDHATKMIVGAEIVGPHAGELIGEAALAIQNQLTVHQFTQTVHPHPSLTESVLMAAEVVEGTVTELFLRNN